METHSGQFSSFSRIKHTHVSSPKIKKTDYYQHPKPPLNPPFSCWTTVLISNITDYFHLLLNFKLLES